MDTSTVMNGGDSRQPRFGYDQLQRGLHWSMAAIILVAIVLGVIAAFLPVGQQPRKGLLEIHKSLGMTALVLVMLRLAWRARAGEPPYRRPLDRMTHWASRAGHAALYVLMIAMPATGYMFSASGGYSLPWFGLFQWPRVLPNDKAITDWGELLHDRAAWIIGAVVLLHLAAVAWHHWIKRDEVLSRMTGGRGGD
jgi:cytochrome b561